MPYASDANRPQPAGTGARAPVARADAPPAPAPVSVAVATPAATVAEVTSPPQIQFNPTLSVGHLFTGGADTYDSAQGAMIRDMWAALTLDAQRTSQAGAIGQGGAPVIITCEPELRACLQRACGTSFENCATDTDVEWGRRVERCATEANCSGRESTEFGRMFRADRDVFAAMAGFNSVTNCAQRYNACILEQCGGVGFPGCITTAGGNAAIRACERIFNECRNSDSALQNRINDLFATVRTDAEINVAQWERRLHEIRDEMDRECRMMGGMLDLRSLRCLFTVELHTMHEDLRPEGGQTLLASRRLNQATEFMCTPEWFGLDMTTWLENLALYARNQAAAMGTFMGAGIGTGVGVFATQGLRAIQAVSAARRGDGTDADDGYEADTPEEENLRQICEASGGRWQGIRLRANQRCRCPDGQRYDHGNTNRCVVDEDNCANQLRPFIVNSAPANHSRSGAPYATNCNAYSGVRSEIERGVQNPRVVSAGGQYQIYIPTPSVEAVLDVIQQCNNHPIAQWSFIRARCECDQGGEWDSESMDCLFGGYIDAPAEPVVPVVPVVTPVVPATEPAPAGGATTVVVELPPVIVEPEAQRAQVQNNSQNANTTARQYCADRCAAAGKLFSGNFRGALVDGRPYGNITCGCIPDTPENRQQREDLDRTFNSIRDRMRS